MKKTFLLMALAIVTLTANAQLILTTSPYTQTFDAIGTSLPTGWLTYTGASSISLGTIYSWSGSTKFGVWADTTTGLPTCTYCTDVFGKGFKNSAAFDGSAATDGGDVQKTRTDRVVAIKQTSFAGYNPGPAFVLHIANTIGLSNLTINFKLQSLDNTDPAVTTWTVDYGVGASPTAFTPVAATGDMTTGGYTFKSNAVSASFGTALNNSTQEIWIRIVTLAPTVNTLGGNGNRACTGINDFNLTFTGAPSSISTVSERPEASFIVLGTPTRNKVNFEYNVSDDATYNLAIYDITGRTIHSSKINASTGVQQVSVNGLNLLPGMYFARMSNNINSVVTKVVIQ